MQKFYFDTFDGEDWTRDDIGVVAESVEAARKMAQLALADMAHEALPNGNHLHMAVRIRDQQDIAVGSVKLAVDSD